MTGRIALFETIARAVPAFDIALRKHEAGDTEGARKAYLDLTDQPQLTAVCLNQLGIIAFDKGEYGRAAEIFQQSLRLDSTLSLPYRNLSQTLERLGNPQGAIATLVNLGCTLQLQGDHEQSIILYQQILARDPLSYAAHINLGTTLAWSNRLIEATHHLLHGITLYGRQFPEIGSFAQGLKEKIEGSIPSLASPTLLPPGLPHGALEKIEDALTTLGKVLANLSFHPAALSCYHQAVACAPAFALGHWNLALALLGEGDFKNGWKEYEWRWHWAEMPEPRRLLPIPTWRGESLEGKRILIWGEQGSGDIIQFLPLVMKLRALARDVIYEVPTQLLRMMQQSLSGITVINRPDSPHTLTTDMPIDFVLPQMSLPYYLNVTPEDLPLGRSYISTVPEEEALWKSRLLASAKETTANSVTGSATGSRRSKKKPKLKVGIVWAGNPKHAEDARRSIPFSLIKPLLENDTVAWYSLQVSPNQIVLSEALSATTVTDLAPYLNEFADTAAAIKGLDRVICVDTAVAHLAAALDKPVWLLLPKVSDWRWGYETESTPWYPTVRIFRQTTVGDWGEVIERVSAELNC